MNKAVQEIGAQFNMEGHWQQFSVPEYSNSHPTAQETNMFRNFANQVRSGEVNETWPDLALKTQQMMNACYELPARESPVELG